MFDKFTDFEKHTSNILKLLDQKSRTTVVELNNSFDSLKKQLEKKHDTKVDIKPLTVDEKPLTEQAQIGSTSKTEEKVPEVKPEEKKSDNKKSDDKKT